MKKPIKINKLGNADLVNQAKSLLNKRSLIALVMAAMMTLPLAGCSKNDKENSEELVSSSESNSSESTVQNELTELEKHLERVLASDLQAKEYYEKYQDYMLVSIPEDELETLVYNVFRYRNSLEATELGLYTDSQFRNLYEQVMYTPFRKDLEYFCSFNQVNWNVSGENVRASFDLRTYHDESTYGGRIIYYLYDSIETMLDDPEANHTSLAKDLIALAATLKVREYQDPKTGDYVDTLALTHIERVDIAMTLRQLEGFCETILKSNNYVYGKENTNQIFGFYGDEKNRGQWGLDQSFNSYDSFANSHTPISEECLEDKGLKF